MSDDICMCCGCINGEHFNCVDALRKELEQVKAELQNEKERSGAGYLHTVETEYEALRSLASQMAEAIGDMRKIMYGLCLDLRQAQVAQRAIDRAKEALADWEAFGGKNNV